MKTLGSTHDLPFIIDTKDHILLSWAKHWHADVVVVISIAAGRGLHVG